MSVLQEYEQIRKNLGEETYRKITVFLDRHPQLALSDVYYNMSVWSQFKNESEDYK